MAVQIIGSLYTGFVLTNEKYPFASYRVIRGFLKPSDLTDIIHKDETIQRPLDISRAEKYCEFLKQREPKKGSNGEEPLYFPEILLGLGIPEKTFNNLSITPNNRREIDFKCYQQEDHVLYWTHRLAYQHIQTNWYPLHYEGYFTIPTKTEGMSPQVKILDGQHRVEGLRLYNEYRKKKYGDSQEYMIPYAFILYRSGDSHIGNTIFYYTNSKSEPLTSRNNINTISNIDKTTSDPFITYMQEIKKLLKDPPNSLTDIEFLHFAEIFHRICTDSTVDKFNTFTEITKDSISLLHNNIRACPNNFQNVVVALVKVYLKEPKSLNSINYETEIDLYKSKTEILQENITRISKRCSDNKTEDNADIKELSEKLLKKRDDYIHEKIELEEHIEILKRLLKTDVDKNDDETSTDENSKKRVEHFVYWINKLYDSTIDSKGIADSEDILDIYSIYIRELEQWKRKIFVAMPFNEECETHWQAIETAVAKFNQNKSISQHLQVTRIDRVKYGFSIEILKTIKDEISTAGLLIADLTDNNPNVYHELGFFLGARGILKETVNTQCILIAREKMITPIPNTDHYTGERKKQTHYPSPTFDVNNFAQIRFEKTKDLSDELYRKFTDIWEI